MKYRKRPVVVEAIQFTEQSLQACKDFVGLDLIEWDEKYLIIRTLEGQHKVSMGDYIIRGVKDEHYPCKPDVFAQTYESMGGTV